MIHSKFTRVLLCSVLFLLTIGFAGQCTDGDNTADLSQLEEGFKNPPVSAKSGVYWYFMDGNMSKDGMTKDLEAMVRVGISHIIFLEVNVGVPRGSVDMLSDQWKDMFKHMVGECERLGVQITLGVGPGWTGSGGPWVKPEESMQHLVSSSVTVDGQGKQTIKLPKSEPKRPFFGVEGLTPEFRKQWEEFYEDVAVLAFPTPENLELITDSEEKSLYYRAPYSSQPGVKQFLPMYAKYNENPASDVKQTDIIDLTASLKPDGTLEWDVPAGKWTVMRFGLRNNGAITRPAPAPGLGMESDKFDSTAIYHHLDHFVGELFRHIGFTKRTADSPSGGLTMLHMDSWEMGAQNWTQDFREQFEARRGYDPLPYYPAYAGVIVGSRELSERFLWDMRKTTQELILENHAGYIRQYAHRHGLGLSIEPYDMNPTSDLELAGIADVPMCEYWSDGYGFNTAFAAVEGTSLAHLKGQPVVPAEAFTAHLDGWDQYPGKMKNQTDWALSAGINRLMFHTFQHQCLPDNLKPGMTMGPYGVHWDRNQTWWEMGKAYHDYLSRSQFMLQQGRTVADILYLCPEGNPHVFRAPASAFDNAETSMPDKKGYAFDACPPSFLYGASVDNGEVVFESGARYKLLVLPYFETMTPGLLAKIKELLENGATVVGVPPVKSPSLVNYPQCDTELANLVNDIWGSTELPAGMEERKVGKGRVLWGSELRQRTDNLYPHYDVTAAILASMGVPEDFAGGGDIRYAHRTMNDADIYFVANRSGKPVTAQCNFRIAGMKPQFWDAVTGEISAIEKYSSADDITTVPVSFDTDQSYFIVFSKGGNKPSAKATFSKTEPVMAIEGPWQVSFDPQWGGPANVTFDKLTDWTQHPDEGIKYYSGTAVYEKTFDAGDISGDNLFLDLGEVGIMAKVWLNGQEAGTVWTYPWRVNITDLVKPGANDLKIEVVNLWRNRLIGDDFYTDDGITAGQWPAWVLDGTERPVKERYTFTTYKHYTKDSALSPSGLAGPVRIVRIE